MATDEALDLLRRRVVNVVGHELRTPVTIVRGLAESLAVANDDVAREQLIAALVRSSARLEGLVDELLLAAGVSTAAQDVEAARQTRVLQYGEDDHFDVISAFI
ncbi:MAG TPA: histidine kinase dimerization/phospho-acceptor domain-containing protein, partial [Acidimicrobiales bacterium]|nr:histidine kinase dimerization/phospho-acceptor domain-containing protein [Acidimicrobiales bacterium]